MRRKYRGDYLQSGNRGDIIFVIDVAPDLLDLFRVFALLAAFPELPELTKPFAGAAEDVGVVTGAARRAGFVSYVAMCGVLASLLFELLR